MATSRTKEKRKRKTGETTQGENLVVCDFCGNKITLRHAFLECVKDSDGLRDNLHKSLEKERPRFKLLSVEDLCSRTREEEYAEIAENINMAQFFPWHITCGECGVNSMYHIPIDDFLRRPCEWFVHLMEKNWFDPFSFADVVSALRPFW